MLSKAPPRLTSHQQAFHKSPTRPNYRDHFGSGVFNPTPSLISVQSLRTLIKKPSMLCTLNVTKAVTHGQADSTKSGGLNERFIYFIYAIQIFIDYNCAIYWYRGLIEIC